MGPDNLAYMLREGKGVSRNDPEAVEWFRKAAAQGNPNAKASLDWMIANGRGGS